VLRSSDKGFKGLYLFSGSKEVIIGLLPVLCIFLAVTTFSEETNDVIWGIVGIIFSLLLINLSLCTIHRIKTLSRPVLIIHIGVILTFIGGGISLSGFVATVNIYEGTLAEKVYNWNIEKDVSLGVDIMVKKLHEEYYPVPVKVGVLENGEKKELYRLKTGESFNVEEYRIKVDSIDISAKTLKLSVFNSDDYIGSADTLGENDLPSGFPFEFKLVAYMDPVIRRTWVDLALIKDNEIVAEGSTEVNDPLHWNGMNFYHTATDRDKAGNTFVGIQITGDPGVEVVYTGFSVISLGAVIYIRRKMLGRR
jgi:hypothetical protein